MVTGSELSPLITAAPEGPLRVTDGKGFALGNIPNTTGRLCSARNRGEMDFVKGTTGVADRIVACARDAADAYAWRHLGRDHNVHDYGAVGDGAANDAAAIQAAIDAASAAGGGTVLLSPGTYLVGAALSVPSDVTLQGAGRDATVLREHSALGANPIIKILGISGTPVRNVRITGITIRNGTATTGLFTNGKNGVRADYVDGLTIEHCLITEIQGAFGLVVKYATNVRVRNTTFYRCTYSCFTVLIECENIWVTDNTFDTTVSTTATNPYLFATGGETLSQGTFFVKNLWFERNRLLNNPRWEGFDTHGGENIWVRDNYIENVHIGMQLGLVTGYVSAPVLKNIHVTGNKVIQGTGDDDHAAIVINGEADFDPLAEHITIEDNWTVGFGGTATNTIGAIQVYLANDVSIRRNRIHDYAFAAVLLFHTVRGCTVRQNRFHNCRGGASATTTLLRLRSFGLYGVDFRDNVSTADTAALSPAYIARIDVAGTVSVQIGSNEVQHLVTGTYSNPTFFPVEWAAEPTTNLTQKVGDLILDTAGKPGWIVTAPTIGYGSLITSTIVTGDMTNGSDILTIAADSAGDYRWLPEGMNITIAGAGAAGVALDARVIKNSVTTLQLDTDASTTVSAANVTYQTLGFTAY